ncbi:MAG: hypothetical protein C0617_11710 [Desulfuromonas sp.]|uniref:PKD domain-containing protein n=1 Tax=Desulfuromonas sp. TaxID=892 RepID=UPI000CB9EC17|nr:PKD domain-containing protein [Desulfuromonas sp.]PLX83198.1 MAG: hypothetical protein C0617_11710 [Desulfuromonas sp.]
MKRMAKGILFTLILTAVMAGASHAAIPAADREALIALYNSTGGDNWTNNSGWKDGPLEADGFAAVGSECTWFGIMCYGTSQVSQISMSRNNLVGPIPVEITDLAQLQHIRLDYNNLTGAIPPQISALSNLRSLDLYYNQLTGPIPPEVGAITNLTRLHLGWNDFGGSIPPELGNLVNLQWLDLYKCQLSGDVPSELTNLSQLHHLNLAQNGLTGSVNFLTAYPLLRYTNLNYNQFSGTIPPGLGSLSDLTHLDLHSNKLTGAIPPELVNLSGLTYLNLGHNQLNGHIPQALGNMPGLTYLFLDNNKLSGEIPPELGNLPALKSLSLSKNQLMGAIPKELGNLLSLNQLNVHANQLKGEMPYELSNLTGLTFLQIHWNALYTSNPLLKEFVDTHSQSGWLDAQALPPENFGVSNQTENSVSLTWSHIPYQWGQKGYELYFATAEEGPYTLVDTLRYSSKTVDNLDPATTYYFRLRSFTDSNPYNQNRVVSDFAPVVTASTAGTRDIEVAPLSHDFGLVGSGSAASQVFTVSNVGTADLTLLGIDFGGASSSDMAFVSPPALPLLLAAGASAQFEVGYAPTTTGAASATVVVSSDDPDEGTLEITLSGTGLFDPPAADAGLDQTVHVGSPVLLDGSGSSDPDGAYPLSYSWQMVSQPAGSTAALAAADTVSPSFTPDVVGDYTVELIVTDSMGLVSASADQVVLSTYNSAPVADAGADQAVTLTGTLVTLDATQSYDDDGDAFSVLWSIAAKPAGSAATLSDQASPTPQFVADAHGDYLFSLVATDVFGAESAPATVTVSFANLPPVADAGVNQSGELGETIYLDGTGSSDANNDPLTFSWSFASLPDGSGALLGDPLSSQPSFTADQPGLYVVSLAVSDGSDSATSNIEVLIVDSPATVSEVLDTAIETINELDPASFSNGNQQNTMTKKMAVVIGMVEDAYADVDAGLFAEALSKLENDVLKKTDGCATKGAPDKNDWIMDCTDQGLVYPIIIDAVDRLQALL